MIAIIDYGAGNLQSVKNALDYLKADSKITSDIGDIEKAEKIILPGVGCFGDAVKSLEKKSLLKTIKEQIKNKKPYLGICLGLQILFEKSEESAGIKGLGIFKGDVKKFKRLKIPQIGWNSVKMMKKSRLLKGVRNDSYFYFVHSYYVAPKDKSIVLTKTDYGVDFASGIEKDNVFAVQFHPERSGEVGLKVLRNFVKL